MEGQSKPVIDYFEKTSPKVGESVALIYLNIKSSEEDLEKHEALLEGITKDYNALYFMNKQLNSRVIVLKQEYLKGMILIEDRIARLFKYFTFDLTPDAKAGSPL